MVRRIVIGIGLLLAALVSCTRADVLTVFIGTYSDGFYAYDFDQQAGTLVSEEPFAKAEMPNPSYLAFHGDCVYAVSEMPDTSASVWAWHFGGNGFRLLGSESTGLFPIHDGAPAGSGAPGSASGSSAGAASTPVSATSATSGCSSVSGSASGSSSGTGASPATGAGRSSALGLSGVGGRSSVFGSSSGSLSVGASLPVSGWTTGGSGAYRGEDPCYVSTNGALLAVANYTGGTLGVYRLREDGGVAPLDSLLISGTGGPDLSRQETPHVHCAVFTPDGKYLLFSEFSADEIGRLDVGPRSVRNYCRAATLPPDSGPRHLLFDPSGTHLYVIGELSGDITVFDYDAGALTYKQTVKADRLDARGAADIHFSPDGKFLYASLRLRGDGIAIFSVDPDSLLTYAGYQATGAHPRNFNITPNGKFVLVACRDTDSVEIYARYSATGLLTPTGRTISVPRPAFVGW